MYNLHYFFEQDQNKVIAFLKNNFFAVVTGFGEQYPVATQLPLNIEIREGGKYRVHNKRIDYFTKQIF